MRKLLNTLYVTTQGAYLHRDGETIAVKVDEDVRLRVPIHTLEGLVCFGRVGFSPPLLGTCGEHGVGVSFLSEHGQFLARVTGPVSGNVLLRRHQYRAADSEQLALPIVRSIVTAKIVNCRLVLQRGARENQGEESGSILRQMGSRLGHLASETLHASTIDGVRGYEGLAAQIYFSSFNHLITGDRQLFSFAGRSRRPPLDRVNALPSFLYALLRHDVTSALESVGLDPAVGFLHADRPGRPSLALDLMEELRPHLTDRLVLTLINRRQVPSSAFTIQEGGGVLLEDVARKQVITEWQKRKQQEIEHPFLQERIPIGLIPYVQALLLARHLRGGLDAYPPFLWR